MPTLKTDLALALPDLRKAVFSQPTAAAPWTKLSIRPVKLKGRLAFQVEGLRDNKGLSPESGRAGASAPV